MANNGTNFSSTNIGTYAALAEKGRVETGKMLGLTGCEITFNNLPAGQKSKFLHKHTLNEEIYIVISGQGTFEVDGNAFPIEEGSVVRVAPEGVRSINAGDAGLTYVCIQAQAGSLTQCTMDDGVIV